VEPVRLLHHQRRLRDGLERASGALVIADGAVWIWRLADDRFPDARERLDFFHASEHLRAVAKELFGEDQVALKRWLRPLLRQLKRGAAVRVVKRLESILE